MKTESNSAHFADHELLSVGPERIVYRCDRPQGWVTRFMMRLLVVITGRKNWQEVGFNTIRILDVDSKQPATVLRFLLVFQDHQENEITAVSHPSPDGCFLFVLLLQIYQKLIKYLPHVFKDKYTTL